MIAHLMIWMRGMIFWKIKSVLISGYFGAWKEVELLKVLEELIVIYHEAHRGRHELETAFEGFLLEI